MIPTADVRECDFDSSIRFYQPRHLLESAAKVSNVLSAIYRSVRSAIDRFDHPHGLERPLSRHVQTRIRGGCVHAFEDTGRIAIANLKLLEVIDGDTATAAFQCPRQLISDGDR